MRHGGGTDLTHEERFFQFKNLGVLQREDFVVDTADRTGANCKCAHELSLVVASNVPSNRRDVQAQDFHHALLRFESLFRLRSKRTDGTGHFTDEHAILHRFETFDVASEFISPNGSLVAERDRNGMHDVRTAGLSGIAILLGQRQAVLKALLHVAQDHLISVAFEQHQTRVYDVLARRTPVYEFARVIRKHLLESLQKRDNRDGALVELADRGQIKQIGIGVLVNNVGLFLRNHAEFALRLGQSRLGVKPFLCPGLVTENFAHFVRAEQKAVNDAVNCAGSHFSLL